MSTTSRSGPSVSGEVARVERRVGLDGHARVVAAGQMRTATMAGAAASCGRPSSSTSLPMRPTARGFMPGGGHAAAAPGRAAVQACSVTLRAVVVRRARSCSRRSATGSTAGGLLGPFGQLQARRGEDVAKARVLPLARVVEAVEVEVRDGQARQLVGLEHGVGRALDAALHAQRAQQVAHEGGLAGAQRAVQLDEGVAQAGRRPARGAKARRRPRRASAGCGFLESGGWPERGHRPDGQRLVQRNCGRVGA
jgi:hypothetical protein